MSTASAGDSQTDQSSARASRRRRAGRIALASAAVALLGGGAILGNWWATDHVTPGRPPADVVIPPFDETAAAALVESAIRMPDVLGLTRDEATEALADIGIDTRSITYQEAPYTGEAGRVIRQSPVRGASDPATIELTVSTPATVPDLVGMTRDDAERTVNSLGAVLRTTEAYVPGKAVGTVVSVEQTPGSPLPGVVDVTVAGAASSVYAATVEPVTGGCGDSQISSGGTTGDHALTCQARRLPREGTPNPTVAWTIGRKVDRFRADVGIADDEDPGSTARVRVVLDDREVFNEVVRWGTNVPIDVDASGTLRLAVYVTEPEIGTPDWEAVAVVLIDPVFVGGRDSLAELTP